MEVQISSILLRKPISVSKYDGINHEELMLNGTVYKVYPSYYPVGQGQRNMPKALEIIKKILV